MGEWDLVDSRVRLVRGAGRHDFGAGDRYMEHGLGLWGLKKAATWNALFLL